jgi:uncharacterized protein YggE
MNTARKTDPARSLLLASCVLLTICSPLWAGEGITVMGVGRSEAIPDTAELVGLVTGDAELAADALVKFRDNKRRAVDAIEALAVQGLSIEGQGVTITTASGTDQMQMIMRGQTPDPSAAKIRVSERLKITLSGVDAMDGEALSEAITNMIDAGKDSGVTLGSAVISMIEMQLRGNKPQPLAVFRLSDPGAARDRAYEAAMEDARANAQRLADLAGVELGKVVSVEQTQAPTDEGGGRTAMIAMMYGMSGEAEDKQPSSDSFTAIPVSVNLRVRFEIE